MKKHLYAIIIPIFCLTGTSTKAQFLSFKKPANALRSYTIRTGEGDKLQNFVNFTELERTGQDSFFYRLSVMDEQLSKAGHIDFSDAYLKPMAAARGAGLLCIAYLRTEKPRIKLFQKPQTEGELFFQFIDSAGTIRYTFSRTVDLLADAANVGIRNPAVLRYVEGAGFLYAYGDGRPRESTMRPGNYKDDGLTDKIGLLDTQGREIWRSQTRERLSYQLQIRANHEHVWLLRERNRSVVPAEFEMNIFNMHDGKLQAVQELRHYKNDQLNNLLFDLDQQQQPVMAGITSTDEKTAKAFAEVISPGRRGLTLQITFRELLRDKYKDIYIARWKDTALSWQLFPLSDTSKLTRDLSIDMMNNAFVPCYSFLDSLNTVRFLGPLFNSAGSGFETHTIGQMRLDNSGQLVMEQTYNTDTVERIFQNTHILLVPRLYSSYFKIGGRNYIAIGDAKNMRIIDYRTQKIIKQIRRKTDDVNRTFFCSRDGHISIMETDALGNTNVFIEPID
ncbi:hypothetical protein [Rurimicrobium arvi]|uniref:Uncharacterized protein n=1 Tax=Rurimicrobium arvi TaxID=2049916 RepID=A0ABP8MQY6_9BACT